VLRASGTQYLIDIHIAEQIDKSQLPPAKAKPRPVQFRNKKQAQTIPFHACLCPLPLTRPPNFVLRYNSGRVPVSRSPFPSFPALFGLAIATALIHRIAILYLLATGLLSDLRIPSL
jgi:hypothetical protein